MEITRELLIKKNACAAGRDWFEERFSNQPTNWGVVKQALIKDFEYSYLRWCFEELKLSGEWITYYENGKLFCKGVYKKGRKNGEWVYYYQNGKLLVKEVY